MVYISLIIGRWIDFLSSRLRLGFVANIILSFLFFLDDKELFQLLRLGKTIAMETASLVEHPFGTT